MLEKAGWICYFVRFDNCNITLFWDSAAVVTLRKKKHSGQTNLRDSLHFGSCNSGGASNSHYGGNAETYMNVGEAMVELIETTTKE